MEWRDLPAHQGGHLLGEEGLLDAPGQPKLLLDTLAHQAQLVVGVPALHHLPFRREAEDGHALDCHLLSGGRHAPELTLVGASNRSAGYHLVPFCELLLNDEA